MFLRISMLSTWLWFVTRGVAERLRDLINVDRRPSVDKVVPAWRKKFDHVTTALGQSPEHEDLYPAGTGQGHIVVGSKWCSLCKSMERATLPLAHEWVFEGPRAKYPAISQHLWEFEVS